MTMRPIVTAMLAVLIWLLIVCMSIQTKAQTVEACTEVSETVAAMQRLEGTTFVTYANEDWTGYSEALRHLTGYAPPSQAVMALVFSHDAKDFSRVLYFNDENCLVIWQDISATTAVLIYESVRGHE